MRVACFGKLPFHREFLRIGLDSPGAPWMVRWVEQVHEFWSRSNDAPAASPLVRIVASVEKRLLIGVVRQSSDGLRRHPVTLFVDVAPAALPPHLLALASAPVWDALGGILAEGAESEASFMAALAAGVPAPDAGAARAAYGASREPGGHADAAWAWLSGATGAAARHLAWNVVVAARMQADAGALDGVSFVVALERAIGAAPLAASLWVELFLAGVGQAPEPLVLGLRPDPVALVLWCRPPDGRDLAALLGTLDVAPIDDLREAWQEWPPADARLVAGIEGLVSPACGSFDALVAAMRGLVRP